MVEHPAHIAPASALLLGEDHTRLGKTAIEEITPHTAIGISRGRFPKGYASVDPNEDAVYAAASNTATVLVVADGHNGFDAARAAISAVAESAHPPEEEDLAAATRRLAEAAVRAVASTAAHLQPSDKPGGTALVVAAFRGGTIASTTLGDSACFVVSHRRVLRLGSSKPFLSPTTKTSDIRIDTAPIAKGATVVVVSDGILDFAGEMKKLLREVPLISSRDGVEQLIAAAFRGGAGDNLAAGVARSL